ncbi:MAG: S8 family serine peptidase [Gemmatimonadaceae bacterium]
MHQLRKFAVRFSLGTVLLAAAAGACSDLPTAPVPVLPPSSLSLSSASGIPTGKTVVVFRDTASIPAAGLSLLTSLGGTVTNKWDDIGVAIVSGLSVESLTALRASDLVEDAGNDRILNWLPGLRVGPTASGGSGSLPNGDPWLASYYADGTQWSMRVIKADKAWTAGFQGTPTTRVAIVDTGIDYTHRETRGLVDLAASKSFSNLIVSESETGVEANLPIEPQYPGDEPFMDNHFHGTHVGATVASNNVSVAGVAPRVTLIAVKVLSMIGSGTFESVASGILHASGPANADIINMSLGANVDKNEDGVRALLKFMERTIRKAEKDGAIVISAAGNDALDLDVGSVVSTPCEQSTMCVSATGPLLQQNFDQPATYTNFGITAIEVAAPGGNATDNDSEYVVEDLVIGACSSRASDGTLNACRINAAGGPHLYVFAAGTSMASPHVAGIAAQLKSQNPTLSVKGLRDRIQKTADDVGVAGRDVYTNHGRINVARALGLE